MQRFCDNISLCFLGVALRTLPRSASELGDPAEWLVMFSTFSSKQPVWHTSLTPINHSFLHKGIKPRAILARFKFDLINCKSKEYKVYATYTYSQITWWIFRKTRKKILKLLNTKAILLSNFWQTECQDSNFSFYHNHFWLCSNFS